MNVHGTPTLIHVVNSDRAELYLSCQMSQNTAELKGRIFYKFKTMDIAYL